MATPGRRRAGPAVVLVALSSSSTRHASRCCDKAAVIYFVASAHCSAAVEACWSVCEVYIASGLNEAMVVTEEDEEEAEVDLDTPLVESDGDITQVCRSIALPALSVFLVFTCTLSVFPALTSLTRAPSNANVTQAFVPLLASNSTRSIPWDAQVRMLRGAVVANVGAALVITVRRSSPASSSTTSRRDHQAAVVGALSAHGSVRAVTAALALTAAPPWSRPRIGSSRGT